MGAERYDVVRALGRGGMGEVVLARHVKLDRLVVIKRPIQSGRAVRALLDEARVAARLHHPNIVTVLDVSDDDAAPFVAMEYVAGVTLREVLERAVPDPIPVDVAVAIAIDLLRGLAYAHAVHHGAHVGVVHRDVKPRNVMVTFAGVTKLIDFGISRWLTEGDAWEQTSVSGTLGYMAPEQLVAGRVDGRVDQFAVAVTLREMVTGAPPVDGDSTSQQRTRGRPGRDLGSVLDPALAAIVDRGSAPEPADRYADCAAMIDALEAFARDRGLSLTATVVERWMRERFAAEAAAWEHEAAGGAPAVRAPGDTGPTRAVGTGSGSAVADRVRSASRAAAPAAPPVRRRRIVPIAIGAGVVACGIAAAAIVVARRGPSAPAGPVRVGFAATGLSTDDAWLAPVVERMTVRAVRDADDRRFWLAGAGAVTERIELAVAHTGDAIAVTARNRGQTIATGSGASVAEAIDQLAPPLVAAVSAHRTDPGPDPDERAEMGRLGARSYPVYRRYRAIVDAYHRVVLVESAPMIADVEALIRTDPAWAHPYALLASLTGGTTAPALAAIARGRAAADPGRDPSGMALLSALAEQADHGKPSDAGIVALRSVPPDDILGSFMLTAALLSTAEIDEGIAVLRQLHEARPDLQFGADLVGTLQRAGRADEAAAVTRAWASAYPDSEQSLAELVKLAAMAGDVDETRRIAQRLRLIHGERSTVLPVLYDAYLASGDIDGAHRVADRMLLGTSDRRAAGRYRLGVVAVLEGRFAAAYDTLIRAADENRPLGLAAELTQVLVLLHSLAPLVGQRDDDAHYVDELAAAFAGFGDAPIAAEYRFEAALARRGKTCPSIDDALAGVPDDARRTVQRHLLRAAARAGCGTCSDAVAAGFSADEPSTASLLALGICAEQVGELDLARQSLTAAARTATIFGNQVSPFDAMLARYHLAAVDAARGDREAAIREYDEFLHAWGNADRPVPEVAAAKAARAKLTAPTAPAGPAD